MKKWLYCIWGILYIASVALGFIQNPGQITGFALLLFSVMFFVPGFLLLYSARTDGDRKGLLLIRWISLASLVLTAVCLVLFFLFAGLNNETAFDVAYALLTLVSAPMLCSQHWVVSLFLWACLLFASFGKKKSSEK